MKIEIAENLIYSYLKHIEGCRCVQTNWKTSGKWKITEYDTEQAEVLFEKFKHHPSFEGIFKNNSFAQLLKQAEIDVLGLNLTEKAIFGVDVAFHSAGLNYGAKLENSSRVLKKILRTIFIMQCYFKEFDKFTCYFVTPKSRKKFRAEISELLQKAGEIINDDSILIEFISDEDFYRIMVDPLTSEDFKEHDTMDLFARSLKILQLDCRQDHTKSIIKNPTKFLKSKIEKRTENGMKIGQFVQYNMRKLCEQNLLTDLEINNLQDRLYSKSIFNQNFEVLKSIECSPKDDTGSNRYYTNEIFFNKYRLTSQWFEYHWDPFIKWLNEINRKNNAPYTKAVKNGD